MEMSPSWSRARDWKSRNRQKRFESSNLSISARKPIWAAAQIGFCFFIHPFSYIFSLYSLLTASTLARCPTSGKPKCR